MSLVNAAMGAHRDAIVESTAAAPPAPGTLHQLVLRLCLEHFLRGLTAIVTPFLLALTFRKTTISWAFEVLEQLC